MRCHTSLIRTLFSFGALAFLTFLSFAFIETEILWLRIAGWASFLLFGYCAVTSLLQLLRGGPIVIFDDAGIHDFRYFGTIRWEEVLSIRRAFIRSHPFLCVEVRDPEGVLARLPASSRWVMRPNRALGFSEVSIGFAGLSPGFEEVWKFLLKSHPEKIAE